MQTLKFVSYSIEKYNVVSSNEPRFANIVGKMSWSVITAYIAQLEIDQI